MRPKMTVMAPYARGGVSVLEGEVDRGKCYFDEKYEWPAIVSSCVDSCETSR